MREFKKRLLEFKYDGKVYKLSFPTVDQVESYQNMANEGLLDIEMKPTYTWLSKLGLPVKDSKNFEMGVLKEVITELLDFKKK